MKWGFEWTRKLHSERTTFINSLFFFCQNSCRIRRMSMCCEVVFRFLFHFLWSVNLIFFWNCSETCAQEEKEISFALLMIELFKDISNSIMHFLVHMVPSALSRTLFQIMKKQGVCGFWMSVWFLPRKLFFFDSLTFLCIGKWLLHQISEIYDLMATTVFHLFDINLISVPFSFVYHTV